MQQIRKYPRTHHIEGSRAQPGDEDLDWVPFHRIAGRFVVVEEKLDGANAAISFGAEAHLRLQSRGHFLAGGPRERQFALLKAWASVHRQALWELLGTRYVLYGEWLFAKHTIFYDALPHYFFEFDVLDTHTEAYLSTGRRRELLEGSPLVSVPVLWSGQATSLAHLRSLVTRSVFKSDAWAMRLRETCAAQAHRHELVARQTDATDLAEGLYIKVEAEGRVIERYKFVRADFLQTVADSAEHWSDRPILPNRLLDGYDILR